MQISKNWLKEFVDIKVSTDELCNQLTMLGLEVEEYKTYKSKLTGEDAIIKLDITPNRGDCFSIIGLARELSALNGSPIKYPKVKEVKETVQSPFRVKICKEAPLYIGRFISNIDLKKKTPELIKERLKLSNIRIIDPVVDITNYVLIELGQPLHAFDSDCLKGNLEVRFAEKKEKITLLDEEKLKFDNDCLVIADENKPIAFAGVMGGFKTGVTNKTKSIFLESAFFKPKFIRGKARRFGIQTEASMRFERGVDFELQTLAIERASLLVQEIMGGEFGPVQKFVDKSALPVNKRISLSLSNVNKVLGSNLTSPSMINSLSNLGLEVLSIGNKDILKVGVPSWRFDLSVEADLIEEIARLEGYDKLPQNSLRQQPRKTADSLHQSLRRSFKFLGYNEVMNYSFISQEEAKITNKKEELSFLENPISQNMCVMRPSLLPGLLNTCSYNNNRGAENLKIFEIGSVFHKKNKSVISEDMLVGGLISGLRGNLNWSKTKTEVDFFDLKGDLESISSNFSFRKASKPFLQHGKTSSIFKGKKEVGYLGSVSPKVIDKLDIKQEVYFFELSLNSFDFSDNKKFRKFSLFPLAQRDLCFITNSDVQSKEVMDLIIKKSGNKLKHINIFDVYEGQGVPKGKKSLAFSLFWQATNRTMIDSEIDDIVEEIVSFLSIKLDAKLRT